MIKANFPIIAFDESGNTGPDLLNQEQPVFALASTSLSYTEIEDFLFHDLRHVAINNLRKAGNDYFKIMGASGHKTMSCFKRYNKVTEAELKGMIWTPEVEKTPPIATNMDTNEKGATAKSA